MSGPARNEAAGRDEGQSYWRGEDAGFASASYRQSAYGTNPYTGHAASPYNAGSADAAFKEPHYRDTQPDDAEFLARQADMARAVVTKDHVAAALLAIFLGIFGIHKFYLGYYQAGFIMLAVSIIGGIVSFGLAAAVVGVIAIVEGVIYLSKSQTEFDAIYVAEQRDWF